MIGIDKLLEECNYILDNDIKSVEQVKEKLDAVKQEIKTVKDLKGDRTYSDADISVDDLRVKMSMKTSTENLLMPGQK